MAARDDRSACRTPVPGSAGRRRPGALPAALLAAGLLLVGCSDSEPGPGSSGPPVSGAVAPDQITVEWAGDLCTELNPVFDVLEVPDAPRAPGELVDHLQRVEAALDALRSAKTGLTSVGPPPSEEAQVIIERVDQRLEVLDADLEAAAAALRAAVPGDPAAAAEAVEAARAALLSFDRSDLGPLLEPDPAVRNALAFAPACEQP
jgi:hypothetical protein